MKKSIKTILVTTALTIVTACTAFAAPNAKVNADTYTRKQPTLTSAISTSLKKDKTIEITQRNNAWVKTVNGDWITVESVTFTDDKANGKLGSWQADKTWKIIGQSQLKLTIDDTTETTKRLHNIEKALYKASGKVEANGTYSFNRKIGTIDEKVGYMKTKDGKFKGVYDAETAVRQAATAIKGLTILQTKDGILEFKSAFNKELMVDVSMSYKNKLAYVNIYAKQ